MGAPPSPRPRPLSFAGLFLSNALFLCAQATGADGSFSAYPLAPYTARGETPLFQPIPVAVSGLDAVNAYDDPRMWDANFFEFAHGPIGTGIAVGDINGDKRPDLCLMTKTGGPRLYRNEGDFRFKEITREAGLAAKKGTGWHQGAALADVDNDGDLDLFLCRFRSPNQLWINDGTGRFQEEAESRGVATVTASGMGAFCDYDRDGDLDLYLLTNVLDSMSSTEGEPDRLFRNEGKGRFVEVTDAAGIQGAGFGHSATWLDYNEDGWPDLYVANDFAGLDAFYRNRGDGTFENVLGSALPYVSYSSMGSDVADIDNDGHLDLYVADMAATQRRQDHVTMAESRAQLNRAGTTPGQALRQVMRNTLYLGTGTDRVKEAGALAGISATDWTWSPRFEDFDNDGYQDVFVTNGMVIALHDADLNARLRAAERPEDRLRLMREMPRLDESNLAFRGGPDLHFSNTSKEWGLNHVGVSFGSATADFDGDGDLDIVYSNFNDTFSLYRNDASSGNRLTVFLKGKSSNSFGLGARVFVKTDRGQYLRYLVSSRGYLSTSEPMLHFGLGNATQINEIVVEWPSGKVQRLTGVSANQRLEVEEPTGPGLARPYDPSWLQEVAADLGIALSPREKSQDEPAQPALLPWKLNRRGPALMAGDLNGDGRDELVMGGTTGEVLRILQLDTKDFLGLPTDGLPPGKVNDGPGLVADFTGDGRAELLVTRGGVTGAAGGDAYQPLYLQGASPRLVPMPLDAWPAHLRAPVSSLVAADFDRDGDLDLFVGGRSMPRRFPQSAPAALLQNQGDGRFVDITETVAPGLREVGLVSSALWTDTNQDGWLDLVIAVEWGTVRAWQNREGSRFEDNTEKLGFDQAGFGWWTGLAAGDFNGDGRVDYAVGNAGLNTPYEAAEAAPLITLVGDFRGNGTSCVIETQTIEGVLWPRRARSELGSVLPDLLKKFPSAATFASTPLEGLFPANRLAAAKRLKVTQLQSGFFLSEAEGRFRFRPAPRLAQLAPWYGMEVTDANADGKLDVLMVGNSRAPIASTGPFEGGLGALLLGDGKGDFTVADLNRTGWSVAGDAQALISVEHPNRTSPLWIVSRNTEATLAFTPREGDTLKWFVLDFSGVPVAQQAGATYTLHYRDGAKQHGERSLGSGWMSQRGSTEFYAYRPENRVVRVTWQLAGHAPMDIEVEGNQNRLRLPRP